MAQVLSLKFLVIVLLFTIGQALFVTLANWQYGRYQEKSQLTPPAPDVITGQFAAVDRFWLKRPHGRTPGYFIFTDFTRTEGETILINRGWVPLAAIAHTADYQPLATQMTLTGHHTQGRARGWFKGPVYSENPLERLRFEAETPYFHSLSVSHPAIKVTDLAGGLPAAKHLEYMATWLMLAVIWPVLWLLLWRHHRRAIGH